MRAGRWVSGGRTRCNRAVTPATRPATPCRGLAQGSGEFLGAPRDPWGTQPGMFWVLTGATLAVTLLLRWHDQPLKTLSWVVSAIK